MRIVAISDTHNKHRDLNLPQGDVLIHTGDFTKRGSYDEYADFLIWFDSQPFEHKIYIAGNHDMCLDPSLGGDVIRETLKASGRIRDRNLYYLMDSSVTIDMGDKGSAKFYGSPWQPKFYDWAFQRERGSDMADIWAKIPNDTDILLTHGPAYGHGDSAPAYNSKHRRNAGCLELFKRIVQIKPIYHIFGHIHCGYGRTQSDEVGTIFINAASCGENYEISHPAQEIDLGAL